jgi:hypothetical protein
MYINVENLNELCECHPELEVVRKITANHGEESEISLIVELIAKLYQKVDALTPKTDTKVTDTKVTEETPARVTSSRTR